ncbi:unnamed protein product, partial [Vitis vinifera]
MYYKVQLKNKLTNLNCLIRKNKTINTPSGYVREMRQLHCARVVSDYMLVCQDPNSDCNKK